MCIQGGGRHGECQRSALLPRRPLNLTGCHPHVCRVHTVGAAGGAGHFVALTDGPRQDKKSPSNAGNVIWFPIGIVF